MDSIHLPNAIALPTAFGAPGTPLPAGQVVQALVLELIESDVFRLQLPQAVVDVRSDVPLNPGSTITLAVKSGGANARLVIYSDAPSAAPAGQGAPPSLAGRQPIGEAVVIARAATPAPIAAPAQARISAEPATIRDALPLSPAPAASTPASRPPDAPVVRVLTPEQAVGEALQTAAPRQAGLAPLFADVEQVVQNAPQAVPAPVRQAAADVLSLRVPFDEKLTASDVKQAFVRSGVLFEPRLAAARAAPPAEATIAAPEPSSDLKAALLVFRQVLKVWSASEPVPSRAVVSSLPSAPKAPDAPEQSAPLPAGDAIKRVVSALAGLPDEPMSQGAPMSPEQATSLAKTLATVMVMHDTPSAPASPNAVPPPYRGAPLNAQASVAPSLAPDAAPREVAERLIAETDGALARQTLLQVASLPEQPDLPRTESAQRWSFEVPFATPQGTSIAQFEVSRDARAPKSDPQARVWRARFSLDVEPMGPVHAMIALTGARTSVSLWAERLTTATQLNENAPLLSEALRAAELEPADFQLRVGAPPVVAKQAVPGRFMDRAS